MVGIQPDNFGQITGIIVDPNHRKMGIGLKLFTKSLNFLEEKNKGAAVAWIRESSSSIFQKGGFQDMTDYFVGR